MNRLAWYTFEDVLRRALSQSFTDSVTMRTFKQISGLMISFKGVHFPKDVILYSIFYSYRDLEDIMEDRGVNVDHATLNHWVVDYSPLIATKAKKRIRTATSSWRMKKPTSRLKTGGAYTGAIDKFGNNVEFMLSEHRDEAAMTSFFVNAINANGFTHKIVMDKSGAIMPGKRISTFC